MQPRFTSIKTFVETVLYRRHYTNIIQTLNEAFPLLPLVRIPRCFKSSIKKIKERS